MSAAKHAFSRTSQSCSHNVSASSPSSETKGAAAPFSLRLTAQERAYLNEQAGAQPLGAYMRERLLGDRSQRRRKFRKPKINETQLALVLAELGRSRLSSNLNQLAKAVNMGTLPASEDVARDLRDACRAVLSMRDALITALGLKTESGK